MAEVIKVGSVVDKLIVLLTATMVNKNGSMNRLIQKLF